MDDPESDLSFGGSHSLPNLPSRGPWLIPALIALVLFLGGVASNWVASDLQATIQPYRRWVWLSGAIALAIAVVTATIEALRRDRSLVPNEKSGGITALNQLRPPVSDFVGREQQIRTLLKELRNGGRACISGMGGLGKTELALCVAQPLSRNYPDGQFFINLQGTDSDPRRPDEVMAICIRAFRGSEARVPEDLDELSHLYRSELSGKRSLLLLDNASDSAQVLLYYRQPVQPCWSLHAKALPCQD